ncbi:condensation domain-containing protein, partial [Salinactinospora qingdaonensis]|uniref:condensation domain-containing protein n=1 Tax=Salinactinospora qingdaonensis TaxID=702744 RepID=UPI0031E920A8
GEPAQISFNYLGQFDGSMAGSFADASGKAGPDWHPANQRPYLIDIVSHIQDGQLHMQWTYSKAAFPDDTIRQIADRTLEVLRKLTAEAKRPDLVGYSPSDFPLSGLSQSQINDLVGQLRSRSEWRDSTVARPLEDCYPQTPIQQGLWFQSQLAHGEGVYHVQMILGIEQELDVEAFRQSWAQTMLRHPILRTSFWTTDGNDALQLVWADLPAPLRVQDWRFESAAEQQNHLETYLQQDRTQGFAPTDAPQWRMLLAQTGDTSYQLIWSAHHAILDGWSISLILNDVVQWYSALTQGHHIEQAPPRPYRDYVSWLQQQDIQQAENYWHDTLKGIEQATALDVGNRPEVEPHSPAESAPPATATVFFSEAETARLQDFAQQHRLTLNTLLQGCWALLLSRYTGTDDVVFGTVVSGRPAEVEGIERMVGLFINTLPLRVHVPNHSTSLDWLHNLQEQNMQMRQYEYSPLNQVQQWSELPANAPLFETLFVFENYP